MSPSWRYGVSDKGTVMGNATLSLVRECWDFLRVRKKWWLGPILMMLVLLSVLIFLTQGSALAPFIYTIF